jgi:sorbose reductase
MAEAGAHVAMFYNSNAACVQKAEALAKQCGVKVKAYQVQGRLAWQLAVKQG